jgi:hypothetical protein
MAGRLWAVRALKLPRRVSSVCLPRSRPECFSELFFVRLEVTPFAFSCGVSSAVTLSVPFVFDIGAIV